MRRIWSEGLGQRATMIASAALMLLSLTAIVIAIVLLATGVLPYPRNDPGITIVAVCGPIASPQTSYNAPVPTATDMPRGGPPVLGAPLAAFTAAYGRSFSHGAGACDNFYVNKAHTVIIGVSFTNGEASSIIVVCPKSWSSSRTTAACLNYLPSDAVPFNVDIVGGDSGICTISLAG